MSTTTAPDFLVEDHGTLFILQPLTPAAQAWLDEHVITEETLLLGGNGVVVEHRYIRDLVAGAQNDELVVR
jgi:hypothetical protein